MGSISATVGDCRYICIEVARLHPIHTFQEEYRESKVETTHQAGFLGVFEVINSTVKAASTWLWKLSICAFICSLRN
jgi:hypothetical protein